MENDIWKIPSFLPLDKTSSLQRSAEWDPTGCAIQMTNDK